MPRLKAETVSATYGVETSITSLYLGIEVGKRYRNPNCIVTHCIRQYNIIIKN